MLRPLRLMIWKTEKIVSALQKVVADRQPPQRWGFDELRCEALSEPVLAALEGVTRLGGETCEEVIRRALTHPGTRRVKLADPADDVTGRSCHPGRRCYAHRYEN